jgi:hypothetical protein
VCAYELFTRPFGASFRSTFYPRLAPWQHYFGRFAAEQIDLIRRWNESFHSHQEELLRLMPQLFSQVGFELPG